KDRSESVNLAEKALADDAVFGALSPHMLHAIGRMLTSIDAAAARAKKKSDKGRAYSWLCAAQMRHPGDFWLNFELANLLHLMDPPEAVGYFRAALAVRKQSGAAWNNYGNALRRQG